MPSLAAVPLWDAEKKIANVCHQGDSKWNSTISLHEWIEEFLF